MELGSWFWATKKKPLNVTGLEHPRSPDSQLTSAFDRKGRAVAVFWGGGRSKIEVTQARPPLSGHRLLAPLVHQGTSCV